MRTFHRGRGDQARFWSISQDEARLTLRYGKVGSPGRAQTLVLDSPDLWDRLPLTKRPHWL